MAEKSKHISLEELNIQKEYIAKIREIINDKTACVVTYGCQQNENDSEKLKGMLDAMGYTLIEDREKADVIIFNTCAVRENAELKLKGNVGALKYLKAKNRKVLIGVCGCMVQQEKAAAGLSQKFRHIDMVFGTHSLYKFPEILYTAMTKNRVLDVMDSDGMIAEDIPVLRDDKYRAWVSIMYGCNNFCSYCVVPYVRGRERSRKHEDILKEVQQLADEGYKEITLLGQNVNSYGNDDENEYNFAQLLREVCKIGVIERVRFATSHPKDISDELIETMAQLDKVCPQLHLPFQAGSNKVLKDMNRGYTKEQYLEKIDKIKSKIPGISLSSDIIVGFPTETNEDFEETINVVKYVEFDSLFTFIYSRRDKTRAALMDSVLSDEEIQKNFDRLLETQNEISKKINESYVGKTVEVLVEGVSKNNPNALQGRTPENKIVNFSGDVGLVGKFIKLKITEAKTWSLNGEIL